jgi:hypothetical protein
MYCTGSTTGPVDKTTTVPGVPRPVYRCTSKYEASNIIVQFTQLNLFNQLKKYDRGVSKLLIFYRYISILRTII